ncbi:uncharacterized protein A4U43_C08F19410 [Asparagus officinalis]|uniref:Uncharacterized protein n=1 Tax=Asparagus officinalis TaxID=4686 RepID=A0A1R3L6P5_ASPOF|nr:uncharacterized protein A4U43_UnF5510 [Asparagus officinalis]ONK60523.1 uncharacterized protein A4U43_C08F19410 [Asparagus officinalis]
MNHNQGDEARSLVVAIEDDPLAEVGQSSSKSHARDAHILSLSLFFIFCAYGAAQNLESTVNTKGDLGTTLMGILYTSFTLFSVVASPVVRGLGTKRALVLGTP